jgi:hypothetical protein
MARAPRGGSWKAEYAQRIARYAKRHPGASRSAARGHARAGEREADRLIRRLRRGVPPGSDIHFTGTDRQPDGTWHGARFDVFAGDGSFEDTFEIPEDGLGRLVEIRDAIAATGIAVLGAAYFEKMLDWLDAGAPPVPVYVIESKRTRRLVAGVGPKGNAKTTSSIGEAFSSTDRRRVARFFSKYPQLRRRGYVIRAL